MNKENKRVTKCMSIHFVITEDNHLISLNDVHSSLYDENKHDFEVTMKDGNVVRVKNMPCELPCFDKATQ